MFRSEAHHILPDRFILHAKIDKDILPALPDPGVDMPVEPDTFGPEIAHFSIEAFGEFRRRNARFWKALFDDFF